MIDPDGKGGVTPFSVYCDMRDKSGVGVTVVSHNSESRTHVGNIPGCSGRGCYSKDVRYTGVSTAQLAALTRVSHNCEQFIKFECNNDILFIEKDYAWWVSRDGTQMSYWGGATGHDNMCACGVTNSCTGGRKCNCDNYGKAGWFEDSGLLTDKSALPVTQIRLGDLNGSDEEGYHTLGKLKCYGQA
ncbi:contactin-associated protein 1-like [Oculina patagonica]